MHTILRGAEARLVETLGEIADRPDGWQAIVFHLNDLLDEYKSEYQTRISVNMVNDLLKSTEGGIYVMGGGTLVVLCHGLSAPLRNKLIFQLRYLYMDDPLAYTVDGAENPAFCTVYDLQLHMQDFQRYATRMMTAQVRPGPRAIAQQPVVESAPAPVPARPQPTHFSAQLLAGVERDLASADIRHTLRRQAVCAFTAAHQVRRVFDELYISINHLREHLKADIDFLSNKWLFKYLTQLLDKRMLTLLASEPQQHLVQPLSININAETLLSEEFSTFNAALNPAMKVGVVFEIHAVDLFADTPAFMIACHQAQGAGYRVCLDGLTDTGFLQVDRGKLGVDLIKLQWNADFADDVQKRENKPLREAVLECGANRVILCRCDSKEAVEYGQALGISLFQGRYIDRLLDPLARVMN